MNRRLELSLGDGRNNAGGVYMGDSLSDYKGLNFRKAREGWELWKRLAWREQMPWDGEWKVGSDNS